MGEILRVSAASIKIFVGVNDLDWFKFLSRRSNIEEANFWQPGGRSEFRALQPGELFLFKLHSPNNFIVGGGLFGHASIVPISLAWEAFGEMNGATSLEEMRRRVARYRRELPDDRTDFPIGCRILEQPFFWPLFWPRDLWLPIVDR
jgi:putative restriction endonuclease